MKKLFLVCIVFCIGNSLLMAQLSDYLSPAFHKERREAFRQLMPPHSVAAIFAYPVRNFSADNDYVYHQNPDLYYLTGYEETNAVLFLFKDEQKDANGKTYKELFFVQHRDPEKEQWTGKRLGAEGVRAKLGVDMVFDNTEFKNYAINFAGFDNIIYDAFRNDVYNDPYETADVYDLMTQFKNKAAIKDDYNPLIFESYAAIIQYDKQASNNVKAYLKKSMQENPSLAADKLLNDYVNSKDSLERKKVIAEINGLKNPPKIYGTLINSMREIKTPAEMVLLQKAIDISCIAHVETMKAIRPGMPEREMQGIQEFVHKKYGSEEVGYGSIVGSGNNGCILHYETNSDFQKGNELVLMDVGAEYHGYTADITRTVPATGKFTKEQLLLYNLVYDAQEAVFKIAKDGTPFSDLQNTSAAVLAKGLKSLGIISNEEDVSLYYPHGVSHHLGLDVHDKSNYGDLKEGMVITVEPGIYIPDGSKCDKKWWGIGVRIEDNVLIEKNKCKVLSTLAPRKAADVEKMVSQKSVLDSYVLPKLK